MGVSPVIFLVGFMGSGKTAVGRTLAERLGIPFVDLDARVEAEAGKSVVALFQEEGEPAFRAREAHALRGLELSFPQGVVVATGGGVGADLDLQAWMASRGRTVWLDASLAAIEARVRRDGSRPLYGDAPAVAQLLEARRPAYARAEIRIDTTELDPAHAAAEILRALGLAPAREATP
jgi:shikimate kinase